MNSGMASADTDAVDAQDKEYTYGKNGESSALVAGSVVCVDITAADGITFKLPSAANIGMPLGVLEEAVNAGAYTSKIVRKGVVTARVLGHANMDAGASLKLVAGQRYFALANQAVTAGEARPIAVIFAAYTTTSDAAKSVYVDF
ncbi:MAG: hypothetical protein IT366_24560 [Candidatus Hydrogenedentes bacterium]|nr:hypothetical protein [Candidatus Hydrogenedentota bacterium]